MRIVLHIDMDAFFAAVEEKANPGLRGLPIIVGADPKDGKGRGVVSTTNYLARKYGIRSALPISKAWELSEAARRRGEPPAVFLPVDGYLYSLVSKRIMEYLRPLANAFEQVSVDEAYIELNFEFRNSNFEIKAWEKGEELAKKIKREIQEREQLTCSIGIGPNKLVAKIGSDMQKPDGLTVVRTEEVHKTLDPLSVRVIPGIGPKTEIVLNRRGVKTIADLRAVSRDELVVLFGKWGGDLYRKARGESEDSVSDEWVAKSIGEQETFERDTLSAEFLLGRLQALCGQVFKRFKGSEFKTFRAVVITVRFSGFETKTRSHTLSKLATTLEVLKTESMKLLLPFLDKRENPKKKLIRLLGVRVEKLQ